MIIEEALVQLRLGPGDMDVSEEYNDAVNVAIEILEKHQSTINDIKAEIEEHSLLTRERAIGIIDRHIINEVIIL